MYMQSIHIPFLEFEWDLQKASSNLAKHGISFEVAIRVFERETVDRQRLVNGETRFAATGQVDTVVLTVVYVKRAAIIRVISARKASRQERRKYEQARANDTR